MRAHELSTLSVAVIAAATCAGCASYSRLEPGTTLGKIEVSGVRVSSRERMVNERLKRREFLESQLTAAQALTGTDFAADGGFSIRSFTGFGAGLGVSVDAGAARLAKLSKARDAQRVRNQQEMDAKDQEILLAMRDKLLAGIKDGKTTLEEAKNIMAVLQPVETGGAKSHNVTSPDPTEAAKWRTAINEALKAVADPTPPAQPATGRSSPIDLFRDKLALLEEIRSELAANELDDRHDLYGSTLVRLSVDATLIPDHDTSAWGVVEMRVKPIFENNLFEAEEFIERLNGLAVDRMIRAKRQYVKACYGENLEVDEARTTANVVSRFAFADRRIDSKGRKHADYLLKKTSESIGQALEIMRGPNKDPKKELSFCHPDFENHYLIPLVSKIFHIEILTTSLSGPLKSIDLYDAVELKAGQGGAYEFKLKKDSNSLQLWLNAASEGVKSLPYAYAATPKEQVQRISQSGSRRDAMELMLALQAVSGAGSASGAISMMQANEVISSALHRQPLVVGYSRTPTSQADEHRRVGWVLGPRFKVEQDARGRPEFGFRHRIVQNTLNAEVAVPLLASGLEVLTCGGWRNEREAGSPAGGEGECPAGTTVIGREKVFLPQSPEALAETFDPDARRPYPELYARRLTPQGIPADPQKAGAGAGAAGSAKQSVLMLQGANLWRNPQVFVGGIKASEVLVLSDMRGIQATFDVPPETLTDCNADSSITVVTSTGSADFGPAGKPCTDTAKTRSAAAPQAAGAKGALKK